MGVVILLCSATQSLAQLDSKHKIYFSHRPSPNQNIEILSYDGKTLKKLNIQNNRSSRGENHPSVSPDGNLISFNTYHFGGWRAGYASIDGSNIQMVDPSRNYTFNPQFSPDNQWILYYGHNNGRTGPRDIYKIRPGGKDKTQLTQNERSNYKPFWSPDGSKIVYMSSKTMNYEIMVMNQDGTGKINVSDHPNHDSSPSWSPDGKNIAFLSIRGGYLNLFVVNADGTGLRNITKHEEKGMQEFNATADTVDELSYKFGTTWSPDSKSIVFAMYNGNVQKLYIIQTDGSNEKELVTSKGEQFAPFWVK